MTFDTEGPKSPLTLTEFGAWWDSVNREFPPYKFTAEELAAQARTWYNQLRDFTKFALDDALTVWLRTQPHRPKLMHMLNGAGAYTRRIREALETRVGQHTPPTDSDRCACGCGGERWSEVLLDAAGNPRTFPTDVKAIGLPPKLSPAVRDGVAAQIIKLGGDFITRDHIECLRTKTDAPPRESGKILGRERGTIAVWTTMRPKLVEAA